MLITGIYCFSVSGRCRRYLRGGGGAYKRAGEGGLVIEILRYFNVLVAAKTGLSFSVSFLSRVDELSNLAGSQRVGLHSSAVRALQRERRGHEFESR